MASKRRRGESDEVPRGTMVNSVDSTEVLWAANGVIRAIKYVLSYYVMVIYAVIRYDVICALCLWYDRAT